MPIDTLVALSDQLGTDPDYDHLIRTDLCRLFEEPTGRAHRCFLLESPDKERFTVLRGQEDDRALFTCGGPPSDARFEFVTRVQVDGDIEKTVAVPTSLPRTLSKFLPEESFASWMVDGPDPLEDSQKLISIGPAMSDCHLVKVESLPIGLQQAIQSLSTGAPPKQLQFLQYLVQYDSAPEAEDIYSQEGAQPRDEAEQQPQSGTVSKIGSEYMVFKAISEASDGSSPSDKNNHT